MLSLSLSLGCGVIFSRYFNRYLLWILDYLVDEVWWLDRLQVYEEGRVSLVQDRRDGLVQPVGRCCFAGFCLKKMQIDDIYKLFLVFDGVEGRSLFGV